MDLLYILGTGSKWNNNELRYSLRSVAQNLIGFGKIWIVGTDPGFTTGINVIEHPDEFGTINPGGNMIRKIIRGCKEPELTGKFLFMNDDFIINRPININDIRPLHKGDMALHPPAYWRGSKYRFILRNTYLALKQKGLPTFQFDYHAPMPIYKENFEEYVSRFNYHKGLGFTCRSIYGNIAYPFANPLTFEKEVIFSHHTLAQINAKTGVPFFVGFNDSGLNQPLKDWLQQKFPTPSKWERI